MPPELGYRIAVCLLGFAMLAISADANRRFGGVSLALSRPSVPSQNFPSLCLSFRGGDATIADSDDEEEDLDELNGEEADEEAEEESTAKLASSAVKASKKSQAKRATKAKSAVNQKLVHNKITSVQKKQKRRKGIKIPYIIKACFNPFTVLAMTKAYFASLFNLDYGKKDESQYLRSALEEKAKKSGGTGGARGKRKMKPGQAKTLSDLPQLST